jgi:broad specificity phosphatase PhoE
MRTVVHLLRHGEVHNPEKILYGRLPGYRLTALGRRMAIAAAESLAGRPVTHLVSSPLIRAQQTAQQIADQFRLPITTDPQLIEAANAFEGKRFGVGDGVLRHPRSWWLLRDPFTPSWGEPYPAIAARMTAALHAARTAAEGQEALCVSHQLPIWTLRQHLDGKRLWHDPRRRKCALGSLTSFHFEDDRLVRVEYAQPAAQLMDGSPGPGTARGA